MDSSPLSRLPSELHLEIVNAVEEESDLFNLLLVSRQFYAEAERALYREISYNYVEDFGPFQNIHASLDWYQASRSDIALAGIINSTHWSWTHSTQSYELPQPYAHSPSASQARLYQVVV